MIKNLVDLTNVLHSTKIIVKEQTIQSIKLKYLALYRQATFQLYVHGYIDDPLYFDEDTARRVLLEEGYRLTKTSGLVSLEDDVLAYNIYLEDFKNGNNGILTRDLYDSSLWSNHANSFSIPSAVRMFYVALMLRQQIVSIDNFYTNLSFNTLKKREKGVFTFVRLLNGEWKDRSLYSPCQACFDILRPGSSATRLPLSPYYFDALYEDLNIPQEVLEGRKEGLFLKGVSLEQERDLFLLVVNQGVPLDGEFAHLLLSWENESHPTYFSYFKGTYLNKIFLQTVNSLEISLSDVVSFTQDVLWLKSPKTTDYVMYGQAIIDSSEGIIVSEESLVAGVSGEFLNSKDNWLGVDTFTGCPLTLPFGSGQWFDLEFAALYGDVDSDIRTFFSNFNITLEYPLTPPSLEAIRYRQQDTDSALALAAASSEAGFFGPVAVNYEPIAKDKK